MCVSEVHLYILSKLPSIQNQALPSCSKSGAPSEAPTDPRYLAVHSGVLVPDDKSHVADSRIWNLSLATSHPWDLKCRPNACPCTSLFQCLKTHIQMSIRHSFHVVIASETFPAEYHSKAVNRQKKEWCVDIGSPITQCGLLSAFTMQNTHMDQNSFVKPVHDLILWLLS